MSGTRDEFDNWVINTLGKDAEGVLAGTGTGSDGGTLGRFLADNANRTGGDDSDDTVARIRKHQNDGTNPSSDPSRDSNSNSSTGGDDFPIANGTKLELTPKPQWAEGIDLGKAKVGKAIKSGSFGSVSWLEGTDEKPLVMKVPKDSQWSEDLQHEAEFYGKIGEHPNIAKCMGIQEVNGERGLVMEGIKGRDMHGTMDKLESLRKGDKNTMKSVGMNKALSQEKFVGTLQYMLVQTLQGLSKLEESGVVHCDVRPDNIMVDSTSGDVKLVDFGLAVDSGERPKLAPVQHGSAGPEFGTQTNTVDHKFDIFATGEIGHKGMERDQFRFGGKRGPITGGMMRGMQEQTEGGQEKTALNRMAPPPPKPEKEQEDSPAEKMRGVRTRGFKLLEDPFLRGTQPAEELKKAMDGAEKLMRQSKDPNEKTKIVDDLEQRVSLAEQRLKTSGQFGAETAYTKFVNWAMNPDPSKRPSAKEALEHPFLKDRLLDDDEARGVLKTVLGEPQPQQPEQLPGSDTGSSNDGGSSTGTGSMTPGTGIDDNGTVGRIMAENERSHPSPNTIGSVAPETEEDGGTKGGAEDEGHSVQGGESVGPNEGEQPEENGGGGGWTRTGRGGGQNGEDTGIRMGGHRRRAQPNVNDPPPVQQQPNPQGGWVGVQKQEGVGDGPRMGGHRRPRETGER